MAKIKVSQATIDKIKKMGMASALGAAKSNKSAEFQEGLRRMYGEKRLSKALGSTSKSKAVPASAVKKDVSKVSSMVKAFNKNEGIRLKGNAVQEALQQRAPKSMNPFKGTYNWGGGPVKKK